MTIDLLSLKPHKVSRDLSGYITLLYGPAKIGKTTFGSRMPKPLLIAFERGYNALPGVIAQDVTTWGEMKQVLRELKKPEVKEAFSSVIIDTVDVAADACQKYICNQLGIENIGDGGWSNNGWSKYKKEFEETFRSLAQLGYAIVFLSHDKEKTISPQNGREYQQICSSMQSSALSIVENMCDIIGYAHPKINADGSATRVLTLRSADNSIRCGCRFPYIAHEIDFSYEALTRALTEAIDKEAAQGNKEYITDEKNQPVVQMEYDYDALVTEFGDIVGGLMNKDPNFYGPRITQLVERYLGKGKKVSETTRDQAEFVYLIVSDIKDELMK